MTAFGKPVRALLVLAFTMSFLASVLLVPSSPAGGVFAGGRNLLDIDAHWARTEILILVANGVISGYPDGTFRPDDPVSRAEMVKMLVEGLRLGGEADLLRGHALDIPFVDVSDSDWYAPYLAVAGERQLIRGYEDGSFGGDLSISRAEAATVLGRALQGTGLPAGEITEFSDHADIPQWAREFVAALNAAGIVRGYEQGDFRPSGQITRAEVAVMICRLLAWRGDMVQLVGALESLEGSYRLSLLLADGTRIWLDLDPGTPWVSASGPLVPGELEPGLRLGLVLSQEGQVRMILGRFLPGDPDPLDPDTFLGLSEGAVP